MSLAKKKERDEGMDYKKTAQEILNHVGGSKNIISAAHCATRLRLVIADNKKADKGALENADDYDVEKTSANEVSCGEKLMVLQKKRENI